MLESGERMLVYSQISGSKKSIFVLSALRCSDSEYSSVGDKISSVPKGTATVAVQYREDTAGTSGETNFSGVHKEAVQPEASVLVPWRAHLQ